MTSFAFGVLTLLFLAVFAHASGWNKRVVLYSLVWTLLAGALSLSGFFENTGTTPPRFLGILIGNVAFVLAVWYSLKQTALNQLRLISLHIVRLPVELILFDLYLAKKVPKSMTFVGGNYDIAIGLSAVLMVLYGLFTRRQLPKRLLRVWNMVGLLFLLNIVVTAVLSAPLPFQTFAFDQPNVAVLEFPYTLLPAFIVPVVCLSHFLSLARLKT